MYATFHSTFERTFCLYGNVVRITPVIWCHSHKQSECFVLSLFWTHKKWNDFILFCFHVLSSLSICPTIKVFHFETDLFWFIQWKIKAISLHLESILGFWNRVPNKSWSFFFSHLVRKVCSISQRPIISGTRNSICFHSNLTDLYFCFRSSFVFDKYKDRIIIIIYQ